MAKGMSDKMKKSALAVQLIMLLAALVIVGRLVNLMLVEGEHWQSMALDQQLYDNSIEAQRGTIFDCNGQVLAKSATVWTVFLAPADIDNDEALTDDEREATRNLIADGLSSILETDRDTIYERSTKNSYYEIVGRQVENDVADKVREFVSENELGSYIGLDISTKRYYPNGSFLASTLGFVGDDNDGLYGIEAYYDNYLSGTDGRKIAAKTARGADMPFTYVKLEDAKDGCSLVLTVDKVVQYFTEKALEQVVAENNAAGGACIVMKVDTGEVLAIADKGDFDPNSPFTLSNTALMDEINKLTGDERTEKLVAAREEQWRNMAVSDTYEPGSVFKMFTGSAAYEKNLINEESTFFCPGYITIAGETIGCHQTSGHGSLNLTDAFVNSCNPAFIEIGQKLGAENFFNYFEAFGFTEKTGIDLPGEGNSIYYKADELGPVELASESFGQSASVTPIQMITAASAIANGGNLMTPHIVKQIIDADGNIVKNYEPVVKRQVLSQPTSKAIMSMLEAVVGSGSGKNAQVKGYRVAGKTGTSEKMSKNNQQTDGKKYYVASFMGIAPADDPEIAVLLLVDEPNGDSIYGGTIAAPGVSQIMEQVLPYLGIDPQYTEEELSEMDITAPSVVGESTQTARSTIESYDGLSCKIIGDGSNVVKQVPGAGISVPKGGTILLYTDSDAVTDKCTVPNMIGKSVAEANDAAVNAGLNVRLVGADLTEAGATAYRQSLDPDTEAEQGAVITVYFRHSDTVE